MGDLSEMCRTCLKHLNEIRFSVYDLKKLKDGEENISYCEMISIICGVEVIIIYNFFGELH